MTVPMKDRTIKTSAWFLYTLIVLEILFMVSPFAAYYYSIYATPLNALQESTYTAWLTMYILPHFAYSDSWLANGLILVSWPLILTGLIAFIFGFCQIYWSKFTGKGAVERGLYRYIRHPQYLALAITGLGCSLYWSRFIVVIAFISMLCLYYFLARTEERICIAKFGDSYREYLNRTGMFLPRSWEAQWKAVDWRLPGVGWVRVVAIGILYTTVITLMAGALSAFRGHVIESLQTDFDESRATVYLAPTSTETQAVVRHLLDSEELAGDIAYVAPASWSIPELGLRRTQDSESSTGLAELIHPTTHGNPLTASQDLVNVVMTQGAYVEKDRADKARLSQALNLRPLLFLELDIVHKEIIKRHDAENSQWAGIPVPTF